MNDEIRHGSTVPRVVQYTGAVDQFSRDETFLWYDSVGATNIHFRAFKLQSSKATILTVAKNTFLLHTMW